MRSLHREQERGALGAKLLVDDRCVAAMPLEGSGVGEASGLAVLAACEADVLEAACWMPGRVLVLAREAISQRTLPIVVKGARLATFSSLVVLGDDSLNLVHFGDELVPVPVPAVLVDREADHFWISKATRLSVTVHRQDQPVLDEMPDRIIDVRSERRRRMPQSVVVAATPGVVRR